MPDRPAVKGQKVTRKRSAAAVADADHRGLYTGLFRLHVLRHTVKEAEAVWASP
jgi:hypothetical protein